ncbi:MAG: hypothetical protein A2Y97_08715 [Nitrospirae bacterium RBG_13_39_12]|nr:MAG: hypothetical protein A2Y97_08705 [Nitrospirae bacterium RBG_13_39_12]OGW37786.1 MAG: hypothetical protein A2Y97_08715 [Nitrospirae bacterium RBG_13_39_12]
MRLILSLNFNLSYLNKSIGCCNYLKIKDFLSIYLGIPAEAVPKAFGTEPIENTGFPFSRE